MQHLNYCRQMARQFNHLAATDSMPQAESDRLLECVALASKAEKFLMPVGGLAVDDLEMRAIDDTEPLRLPHRYIAIEYQANPDTSLNQGQAAAPKRIIFAVEAENVIAIKPVVCMAANGSWYAYPWVAIARTGAIKERVNGTSRFSFHQFNHENYGGVYLGDYGEEVTVLLALLNALRCSNVHTERSGPSKYGKKVKSALPFDSYNILTIDVQGRAGESNCQGGHRSPREHLRRGHIRRLADGRRIWVNAAVIAAGRGAGVVTKDYRLVA